VKEYSFFEVVYYKIAPVQDLLFNLLRLPEK